MTVIFNDVSEAETVDNNTTWNDKLEVTGTINVVDEWHKLFIYCEYTGSDTGYEVAVRVTHDVDGAGYIERGFDHFKPTTADRYKAFCFHGLQQLALGTHTVKLQYVAENSAQTIKIRRARITVERF